MSRPHRGHECCDQLPAYRSFVDAMRQLNDSGDAGRMIEDDLTRLDAALISDTPISSGLSDSAVAHPPRRVDGAPAGTGAPSKNEQEQP